MEHTITMAQWFFIILAADLFAYAIIGISEKIDWSRVVLSLFKKKRKAYARRGKKMGVVIPLKKIE